MYVWRAYAQIFVSDDWALTQANHTVGTQTLIDPAVGIGRRTP